MSHDTSKPLAPVTQIGAKRRGKYAGAATDARLNKVFHDYFTELCEANDFPLQEITGWRGTLSGWRKREVPWEVIEDAFDTMVTARARKGTLLTADQQFRYFCGIVWHVVRAAEAEDGAL